MTRSLRRLAVVLVLASILGCSASTVPIYGSDGKPYVYVDCSGMFNTLDECYRVASSACPNGYRIANSVAPRESPFGNLVIDCQEPAGTSTNPAASTSPASAS